MKINGCRHVNFYIHVLVHVHVLYIIRMSSFVKINLSENMLGGKIAKFYSHVTYRIRALTLLLKKIDGM